MLYGPGPASGHACPGADRSVPRRAFVGITVAGERGKLPFLELTKKEGQAGVRRDRGSGAFHGVARRRGLRAESPRVTLEDRVELAAATSADPPAFLR